MKVFAVNQQRGVSRQQMNETSDNVPFCASVYYTKDAAKLLEMQHMRNPKYGFYIFSEWAKNHLNKDAIINVDKVNHSTLKISSEFITTDIETNWNIDNIREPFKIFEDLRQTVRDVFGFLRKDDKGEFIPDEVFATRVGKKSRKKIKINEENSQELKQQESISESMLKDNMELREECGASKKGLLNHSNEDGKYELI